MIEKTRRKIVIEITMLLVASLLFTFPVSAEFWGCFEKGEIIDFCHPLTPDRTCGSSIGCLFCMSQYDSTNNCFVQGNFNVCNGITPDCSAFDGDGAPQIDSEPPVLTINNPIQEFVYDAESIILDIEVNEKSDISYKINNGDDKWKQVCNNCLGYDRERTFNEGLNDVTFRASDAIGNDAFFDIFFYVDSKEPNLRGTEPRRGFASGDFFIEFNELNPESLELHYGNAQTGMRTHFVDVDSECVLDKNYECNTFVDLDDYNGQDIEYWAAITDIAGSSDASRTEELSVDSNPPVINSFDYSLDGRNVIFNLDITEPYFDSVSYVDNLGDNPREKTLCGKLDEGVCEKKVSFDDGQHDVTVIVSDEAGNTATRTAQFFTDSRDPRISGTGPRRGFASGFFDVEFDEANPEYLELYYGIEGINLRMEELDIDNSCNLGRRTRYVCETFVDLEDYDGEEIVYWFEIEDVLGATDSSRKESLDVDTTFPVINSMTYEQDGNSVEIVLDITEDNLDDVTYEVVTDSRPRERRLCSRLKDGICEKRIRLSGEGIHLIEFQVNDEAGNSVGQNLGIIV